jgi:hypothetical protein
VAANTIGKLTATANLKSFILPASLGLKNTPNYYDAPGRSEFRMNF